MRKLVWVGKVEHTTQLIRYGLVVRISGSHPGGPGSIPGNGITFSSLFLTASLVLPASILSKGLRDTSADTSAGKKVCRRGWDSNPRGQSPLD